MQALAALGAAGLGAAVALVASPARRSPKRPAADVIDPDDGSADEADRVVREVADEAAELAEALEDADDQVARTKGGRGVKKGKHAARRQEGCDRNLIGRELALGCGCKHGCLDHITVGEVLEARSEKVDYSPRARHPRHHQPPTRLCIACRFTSTSAARHATATSYCLGIRNAGLECFGGINFDLGALAQSAIWRQAW